MTPYLQLVIAFAAGALLAWECAGVFGWSDSQ